MERNFQNEVDQYLISKSSRLQKSGVKPSRDGFLFNSATIKLKREHFETIKKAIKGFFVARETLSKTDSSKVFHPPNYSVLMSYDFHITENGPKLIEINTNAGQSMLVNAIYEVKNEKPDYLEKPFITSLRESFLNEAKLCGLPNKVTCMITDENLEQQFFYPEMILFADQMEGWGWDPHICDSRMFAWDGKTLTCGTNKIDFVYNRITDFYLDDHPVLKSAFEAGIGFSPNPFEYHLLANKSRLVEFSQPEILGKLVSDSTLREACEKVLPITKNVREMDFQETWSTRKKYFFKPKTSYAGKGAYRGEAIQRKVLEDIFTKDYLAQEFIRPPEVEISSKGITDSYKYDVRFYAYKSEIQLVSARIYKGQVTNFRTEGSGICTVKLD